ncbi:MAG: hypothetical protein KI786_16170 [Mameliella sp.]|nr:hypothetical protein [Phaeodactylibacter sp.]
MGYARWSSDAYQHLRARYANKSRDEIFQANRRRQINPDVNPYGIRVRESRDSQQHPNSLAIGVFLDVTGSMGRIPEQLVRYKLGTLMNTIIAHGIPSPHIMFSAIGDHLCDQAPLQAGQFEAGANELSYALSKLYLEGGGGGQIQESYLLAWLLAGRHTSIDCFEKRGQKGFLFTVGDEASWERLSPEQVQRIIGYYPQQTLDAQTLLREAQRMYHVFHIHINETGYKNHPEVIGFWRSLLGERALILNDHNALAELIAATVAVVSGNSFRETMTSFEPNTARQIEQALTRQGGRFSSNSIIPL